MTQVPPSNDLPDNDEAFAASLDACFQRMVRGETAGEDDERDVAEVQPVLEALANLSHLLKDSFSEEEGVAEALPVCFGKYLIKQCLGRGGQAIVLLAEDPDTDRSVVLKVHLPQNGGEDPERLLNEARNLARVRNSHVAECYGVDRHEGMPYLVMEHIRGRSLKAVLASREQRLPINEALGILAGVADGLAAVHARGILHGDIKPGNILVDDKGQPRLVDFGFSRPIASDDARRTTGTAAYMAPEQARNEPDRIDVRTDIFGAGAVLYELLTGEAPFEAETREASLEKAREGRIAPPSQRNPQIPAKLESLCMECLAANPEERITAAQLRSRLQSLQPAARRRRLAIGLVGTMAVALLLSAVVAPRWFGGAPPQPDPMKVPETPSATAEFLELLNGDRHPRMDFEFTAEIIGRSADPNGVTQLKAGDEVKFQLRAAEDSFITIVALSEHDPPARLFPDAELDYHDVAVRAIRAGRDYVIPGEATEHLPEAAPIEAVASVGREALLVIASTRPLDFGRGTVRDRYLVFETPEQRQGFYTKLRGFKRRRVGSQRISMRVFPTQVTGE